MIFLLIIFGLILNAFLDHPVYSYLRRIDLMLFIFMQCQRRGKTMQALIFVSNCIKI